MYRHLTPPLHDADLAAFEQTLLSGVDS